MAALGRFAIATNTKTQLRPTYAATGTPGRPTPRIGAVDTARRSSPSHPPEARSSPVAGPRCGPEGRGSESPRSPRSERWGSERTTPRVPSGQQPGNKPTRSALLGLPSALALRGAGPRGEPARADSAVGQLRSTACKPSGSPCSCFLDCGVAFPLGLGLACSVGACGSYVARAPAPDRSARKRPDLVYASLDCVGQRVERFADVDGLAHELAVPDLGSRSR
jgi:hypothetical protein